MNNKARIGAGMIKSAIIGIIFLTVLLSILPSLIMESASSVVDLADNFSSNSDIYGTGASALGGNVDDWTGYFWVVGPLILLSQLLQEYS